MPITIPEGVSVQIAEGNVVTVKGPKGQLTKTLRPEMIIKQEGNTITVDRPSDDNLHRSLHGLTRSLLNNMVTGVHHEYSRELEVNGVGYRVAKEGKNLIMTVGYSHPVIVPEIEGITIDVPAPNKIIIHGCDKQAVGQFAAEVRGKRPPEPYKGKGVKYVEETIRRKVGKTGAAKK
jgi:large subunit ribosomal protein L6